MGKKRQHRIRVHGDRRDHVDTRRLARAIVRLAVEMDAEQAEMLEDALEREEALRRRAVRQRRAERAEHVEGEAPQEKSA